MYVSFLFSSAFPGKCAARTSETSVDIQLRTRQFNVVFALLITPQYYATVCYKFINSLLLLYVTFTHRFHLSEVCHAGLHASAELHGERKRNLQHAQLQTDNTNILAVVNIQHQF
jgi:hypothetical protein